MKILITEPEYFDIDAVKILEKCGTVTKRRVTKKQLEGIIGDFDALVCRIETHVDKDVLEKAEKLKVIGSATTGLDHIDVGYARKLGIRIFNLHGEHTLPTAEYTMALILGLYRHIPWAYNSLKGGDWHRYRFIGRQLQGKTLGIIGLGRIGGKVAVYAGAFGMNIVYYDPYVDSNAYTKVSLNMLMKSSDVVTIHAMLNDSDRHMINGKMLGLMKKDAVLINTARADIVDYNALLAALKGNRIAGAALDVFHKEPIEKNDPVLSYAKKHGNLLVTPHLGASAKEAAHLAGVEVAEKVSEFLLAKR